MDLPLSTGSGHSTLCTQHEQLQSTVQFAVAQVPPAGSFGLVAPAGAECWAPLATANGSVRRVTQDRGQNKFPALDAVGALTRDLRSHVTDEFQLRKFLQVCNRQPANY